MSEDIETNGPRESPDVSRRIKIEARALTPVGILQHADEYERKFEISFTAFAYFSESLLRGLQKPPTSQTTLAPFRGSVLLSGYSADALDVVSNIANDEGITDDMRRKYLNIFLDVYRAMHFEPMESALVAAPRREGMLLARELGWLSKSSFLPHLKRIPIRADLAIGIDASSAEIAHFVSCRIVDGAIASGATVITLMEMLSEAVERFDVYTVHCTQESANALLNYARILGKEIVLHAGFIGGVLNEDFYAVGSHDHSTMIVGDVGDMIAPLFTEE